MVYEKIRKIDKIEPRQPSLDGQFVESTGAKITLEEVKKIMEGTTCGKQLINEFEAELKIIIEDTKREKKALEKFERKANKILGKSDQTTKSKYTIET